MVRVAVHSPMRQLNVYPLNNTLETLSHYDMRYNRGEKNNQAITSRQLGVRSDIPRYTGLGIIRLGVGGR
jgi:hypothetical protein